MLGKRLNFLGKKAKEFKGFKKCDFLRFVLGFCTLLSHTFSIFKALQMDTSLRSVWQEIAKYDKEFSSLRKFAKRERANSWQSIGLNLRKFVDCHARFARSQWRAKGVFVA